ncbi:MAG: GLUG motif-containing protein [Steroidobacteraceae bacterium]
MNHRKTLEQILVATGRRALFCTALLCMVNAAGAAVTISTKPTKNITCNAAGTCTPTRKSAVLNATDLMNLLATSSIDINTGPAVRAAETSNIVIDAPITWSSASTLTLDAYQSVTVDHPVADAGLGGISIITNDGGSGGILSFGAKGSITISDIADSLLINGKPYVLIASPAELARLIADNPSGYFALAAPYDAAGEPYASAPVPTVFTGTFEGLGNRITHLAIHDKLGGDPAGFFAHVGAGGEMHDVELMEVMVTGTSPVGGAVAINEGLLTGSIVDGSVMATVTDDTVTASAPSLIVGGLVGENDGTISYSRSTATVTGTLTDKKGEGGTAYAGGLVGFNNGSAATITASWGGGPLNLTTTTSNPGSTLSYLGGLAGYNELGSILSYSFAVGSVTFTGNCLKCGSTGGVGDNAGGLVGTNDNGNIVDASASGAVVAGNFGSAGGLVGVNENVIACGCGSIDATVATGSVSGSVAGGLLGSNNEIPVTDSTASGVVSGGLYSYHSVGGFVGYDASPSPPQPSSFFTNATWNLATSGISDSTMGAGNVPSDSGITGID